MKTKSLFSLLLLLLISTTTQGQGTQEKLLLSHPDFDGKLSFDINLPAGYQDNTDKSYIVMFDFHYYAHTYLSGMHDWMSHNGEWPWLQTIIVTPTRGNPVAKLFDATGKTTPMLDFFEQSLFTAIDNTYRTRPFRIISGFRRNGTIALSALLNKPQLFNAYFVVSPELKNDYAGVMSSAKQKLAKLDNRPRFVLLTHGASVKEDHQLKLYQQLSQLFQQQAPESLEFHERNFKDHYHMSMPPLATTMGIELLFNDIHKGLPPDSAIAQQGFDAIVKHYDWLSKEKYGFEVSPLFSLRNRGDYLLPKHPQQAITFFQKLQQHYPNRAYVTYYLANAYAVTGNLNKAVALQQQAVEQSKGMLTWHQKRLQSYLTDFLGQQSETN